MRELDEINKAMAALRQFYPDKYPEPGFNLYPNVWAGPKLRLPISWRPRVSAALAGRRDAVTR